MTTPTHLRAHWRPVQALAATLMACAALTPPAALAWGVSAAHEEDVVHALCALTR